MNNPYLMAMFEPIQKPEMTEDEFIESLADILDEEEESDELPDNLISDPVFPVFPYPEPEPEPAPTPSPLIIGDAYAMAPTPSPCIAYNYIEYGAEYYPKADPATVCNRIIKYDNLQGFAEIDVLGLKSLQNKTADGGAQKKIREHKLPNNILIARIWQRYEGRKVFRTYAQCTQNELLERLKVDNGLYEIIDKYPFKPYFDIDEPNTSTNLEIIAHLPKYIDVLNELFKNADFAICGNITDDKISFHIVIHNYLVRDPDERDQLKIIAGHINADDKVYTNGRLMRQINQNKQLQTRPLRIIQGEPKKHIITAFFEPNALQFPEWRDDLKNNDSEHLTTIKMAIQVQKMTTSFNIANQPRAVLNKSIDFDIFTASPLELLQIAPLTDQHDHAYTARIATFCYYNGVPFDEFFKWRIENKKLNNETEESARKRWRDWWDYKAIKYTAMNIQNLIWLILQDCPSLHTDKHFGACKRLLNIDNMQGVDYLKVDQLTADIFTSVPNKYVCVKIGMSGGKTYNTMKYLKEHTGAWAWLSPNIALAMNTHHRMTADGMEVLNYKEYTGLNSVEIKKADAVICCLNSIHYLADPYDPKYMEGKNYRTIIIDEIDTFLLKWHDNSTLNNTKTDKRALWHKFIRLLRNAEKVIFLDAFLSRITLDFIKAIEADNGATVCNRIPLIITRNIEKTPRKVQFLENKTKFDADLVADLIAGKKLFIFYPYKNRQEHKHYFSMEELDDFLKKAVKEATGRELKSKYYHGDTDLKQNKDLYNVNESWEGLDFVICNNKITVGVSFEGITPFDRVYIGVAGMNSPRDILQVSYRPRQLNDELVKICFFDRFNTRPNFKADEKYIVSETGENCSIYDNLVNNIIAEKNSPIQQTVLLFATMAKYEIIDGNDEADEIIKKKIKIYLDQNQVKYTFTSIKDIDQQIAEEYHLIQIYKGEATIREQMEYKKYKFRSEFIDLEKYLEANACAIDDIKIFIDYRNERERLTQLQEKTTLLEKGLTPKEGDAYAMAYEMPELPTEAKECQLWFKEYEIKIAIIWDCRAFESMDALQDIIYNTDSRDYKIFNTFKNMFDGELIPTAEQLNVIIKKKIKLDDDLLNLIFGDRFRTLTKKSSTIHIIKGYYNMTLKRNIIKSKRDKGNHNTASIHAKSETILMCILELQRQKMGNFCTTEASNDQETATDEQINKLLKVCNDNDDITTNEDY
jgi:hypothetical protein